MYILVVSYITERGNGLQMRKEQLVSLLFFSFVLLFVVCLPSVLFVNSAWFKHIYFSKFYIYSYNIENT